MPWLTLISLLYHSSFFFLHQATSEVYYITANATDLCTVQPCLTFVQFVTGLNHGHYLHSNMTLIFLPGTHYLRTVDLALSNVDHFLMKSANSTAQIRCTNDSQSYSINFSHSQSIHINNLEFVGCGGTQVRNVQEFVVEDTQFKGRRTSSTALNLVDTTAQIVNSIFVSNRKGIYRECIIFYPEYGCAFDGFIGGAIVATRSIVDISQSKFEDNEADFGGAIFAEENSIISMSRNTFIFNSAVKFGGALHSYTSNITIEECEFHDNNAANGEQLFVFGSIVFNGGGALSAFVSTIKVMEASKFYNNSAIGVGGVLISYKSNVTIETSEFRDNSVTMAGGVLGSRRSTVIIEANKFHDNSALLAGGVLVSDSSIIAIEKSEFHNNLVDGTGHGGVVFSNFSTITIEISEFYNNSAYLGGVLFIFGTIISVAASGFHDNSADSSGGVLYSYYSTAAIATSEFHGNSVTFEGGVLTSFVSTITIVASGFHNNHATIRGGALHLSYSSVATIGGGNFTNNTSPLGAAISVITTSSTRIRYAPSCLLIRKNKADRYAVIYLSNSELVHELENVIIFSNNFGSLVAFNSNITFAGYAAFVNNQPTQTVPGDFQEGGAITLFQSNFYLYGECNLKHNHAENGGAIHSTESKLYVSGNVTIAHNTAARNGGGVFLSTSELNCQHKSTFEVFNNTAVHKGGGIHATGSHIKATSTTEVLGSMDYYTGAGINITGNAAERGGGLSLEANAKLYVLKYDLLRYSMDYRYDDMNTTRFTANSAHYGGAVYVDDDSNSGTCAGKTTIECFFQVLALHGEDSSDIITQSIYFSQNFANISGSTLYGGLLDRCAVNPFAEVRYKHDFANYEYRYEGNGESYLEEVSAGKNTFVISSLPVRVCFCIRSEPSCTHQSHTEVKKGEAFTFPVVAVDQIGQPVSATIQTSLHFTESGLAEGQLERKISAECTNLTFSVVSSHHYENLSLYASDGPCKDAELSTAMIEINFLPCTCQIGLQVGGDLGMNSTNCTCECHSDISRHVEHCDSFTGRFLKQPQSRAWISYSNDTALIGYVVYPNCPFDYCLSTGPLIDLNRPNGADAQCAFNRSSLLCGSCRPGLSLSLGSSRCLPCPSYWPALL